MLNKDKDSIDNNDDVFFSFKTLRAESDQEQRKIEEEGDGEIINIYHHNMPKKLERKTTHGLKIIIIGLLILFGSGVFFYYYGSQLFTAGSFFAGKNVKLEITGLSEVSAGEEVSYIIKYNNLEKIDLSNVVLTVKYPANFVYKKSKPLPTGKNNNNWDLGYLKSSATGEVEIYGYLVGEQDQSSVLQASLDYNLGTEKSSGNQKTEMDIKISSSVLSLNIEGPSRLIGDEVKYTLVSKNNSTSAIEGIKISVTYPEGFIFKDSKPALPQENSANKVWLINQLDDQEERKIIITGNFEPAKPVEDGQLVEDKVFSAQIGILDEQDVFYVQQQKEFKTVVASSDLVFGTTLNGSDSNAIIKLGDNLKYVVNYTNQSQTDLSDVSLKLIINSNILDWSSIKVDDSAVVADEEIINSMLARSITWNLNTVKAGESGAYNVEIKAKTFSQLDRTNTLDLKAESLIKAKIGKIGEEVVNSNVDGNKIVGQVNTELKFTNAVIQENAGDYQLEWSLTNSIHEVDQVKVLASLSADTSWATGSAVTAGDLFFEPDTNSVSWQINRIPAGIDIPLTAKFKIKTTASGRPKLLDSIIVTAKDKITGAEIKQEFSAIMGN